MAPEIKDGTGPDWRIFGSSAVPYEYTEHERDQYRAEAYAVIAQDRAALMAAGRLLPEPLETRTEWGYLHPGRPVMPMDCEEYADVNVRIGGGVKQRREVQVFADGRELVGPWVAVDPDTPESPR
jgi:hypothetical protein